ncbi:MAG TPA: KH domain-containing protein [Anaeromyxobacteraceae bacterium]|nr:KH domain-containing protein [Anaeromyxobacteraceae bacterium]
MAVRDLVMWLAQQLVADKGAVKVDAIERDRSTIFELTVAENDLGRVIGRGGRTAKAFRTVLETAARRQGRRAVLDIVD